MTAENSGAAPAAAPLGRVAAEAEALIRRAAAYATRARAENTRRAYASAARQYEGWCEKFGVAPLHGEPRLVALYLADAASRLAVATLKVHLAAIAAAHRRAGVALDLRHAAVAEVMAGIVREKGTRPGRVAAPLLLALLPAMVGTADGTLARRDRALLLLCFGAALRRSEAAALDRADVAIGPRGVKVLVRAGKGDRDRAGEEVVVRRAADSRICAAAALASWLERRGTAPGPLFQRMRKGDRIAGGRLSDRAVARIVKAAARRAGLDPAAFSGHSPRAGLATEAAAAEAPLLDIMRQTRHRSAEMVRRYVRDAELWTRNVTERLFAPPPAP